MKFSIILIMLCLSLITIATESDTSKSIPKEFKKRSDVEKVSECVCCTVTRFFCPFCTVFRECNLCSCCAAKECYRGAEENYKVFKRMQENTDQDKKEIYTDAVNAQSFIQWKKYLNCSVLSLNIIVLALMVAWGVFFWYIFSFTSNSITKPPSPYLTEKVDCELVFGCCPIVSRCAVCFVLLVAFSSARVTYTQNKKCDTMLKNYDPKHFQESMNYGINQKEPVKYYGQNENNEVDADDAFSHTDETKNVNLESSKKDDEDTEIEENMDVGVGTGSLQDKETSSESLKENIDASVGTNSLQGKESSSESLREKSGVNASRGSSKAKKGTSSNSKKNLNYDEDFHYAVVFVCAITLFIFSISCCGTIEVQEEEEGEIYNV